MIITDKPGEGDLAVSQGVPVHTLYYFPFSLYSLIVRFAVELGYSVNPETSPAIRLRFLDLHQDENFSEEYLQISPNGQVPTLSCHSETDSSKVLTESREILQWLCEAQPELVPDEHRHDIETGVDLFYSFHAKPLNVKPEERSNGITNVAAEMLERTDISDPHRRSLEIRSVFHDMLYGTCLDRDNVEFVEEKAHAFVQHISSLVAKPREEGEESANHKGKFIFSDSPTVLDAIATTLIARLLDMERNDLVNEAAKEYAQRVMSTEAWKRTTHGRSTAWNPSIGKAAEVSPL